jgi:hypothetical protein
MLIPYLSEEQLRPKVGEQLRPKVEEQLRSKVI